MGRKQLILFIALAAILLLHFDILAQQDTVSQHVKNYWQLMDNFSSRYTGKNDFVKNYSSDEIDTLTKAYYRAINEDPIGYKIRAEREYKKWDSTARAIHGLPKELKPAIKLRLIKEMMSSKYGKNFTEIISVPYYLKVKIIGDSGSIYEGPINSKIKNNPRNVFRTSQGNLIALVEDVIKGNKFFKVGQEITISYLTFWIAEGGKFFEKGKTYFIPLEPWDSFQGYSKITIDILSDNNYAIYPIENDIISTPGDYFGIGASNSWNSFKQEFIKKYILNS